MAAPTLKRRVLAIFARVAFLALAVSGMALAASEADAIRALIRSGVDVRSVPGGGHWIYQQGKPVYPIGDPRVVFRADGLKLRIHDGRPSPSIEFRPVRTATIPLKSPLEFPAPLNLAPDSACVQGLCWDFRLLEETKANRNSFYDSNYVITTSEMVNMMMMNQRHVTASPEALQFLSDLQAAAEEARAQARSDESIQKEAAARLQELAQAFLSKKVSARPEEQPAPYPADVSRERIDRSMRDLRESNAKGSPILGARAVAAAIRRMAFLETNSDLPGAASERDYLTKELRRLYVDRQGFLKGLNFAAPPEVEFRTSPASPDGMRIRESMNNLLAAEEVAQFVCAGLKRGANSPAGCDEIAGAATDLKWGHVVADRLASAGKRDSFRKVMDYLEKTIRPAAEFVGGFGMGAATSVEQMVTGVAHLISHPIETGEAIYEGLKHYDRTWNAIVRVAEEKYDIVLNGSDADAGAVIGELTADIASFFIPAGSVTKFAEAAGFGRAVAFATSVAAVEKGAQVLQKAGRIVAEDSKLLVRLAGEAPASARAFYRGVVEGRGAGATVFQAMKTGMAASDDGIVKFATDIPVRNPFPENGVFARVVRADVAQRIKSGELDLARALEFPGSGYRQEAFITAYDDVAHLAPKALAERLSLYEDDAARHLRDTSDYVVMRFEFKDSSHVQSPIETIPSRNSGFLQGGRTRGGAREWIWDMRAVAEAGLNWRDLIKWLD